MRTSTPNFKKWNSHKALWRATLNVNNAKRSSNLTQIKNAKNIVSPRSVFPTDEQVALSYIVWACGPQGAHLTPHEEHRRANLNSELKTKWNSRKALWRATLKVNNAKRSSNLMLIKTLKICVANV